MEITVTRVFGAPGQLVTLGDTGAPLFYFDEKGEYLTIDKKMAERLKIHFRCEELKFVDASLQNALPAAVSPAKPKPRPAKKAKQKKAS